MKVILCSIIRKMYVSGRIDVQNLILFSFHNWHFFSESLKFSGVQCCISQSEIEGK